MSWSSFKPPAKLDPILLDLNEEDQRIAEILAEEIEKARAERLERELAAVPADELSQVVPAPPMGLLGSGLHPTRTRAQAISDENAERPWDALLRDPASSAHSRAAERTGMTLTELLDFAVDKCGPANWEALFWYRHWVAEIARLQIPWAEARQLIAEAREHSLLRSREAGSRGGLKSAQTRRLKTKIPLGAKLEADARALLASGTAPRDVNGKLAQRYGVTTGAVAKARRNLKSEKRS